MNKNYFIKFSALFACLLASSCSNNIAGTSNNVETFNLKNGDVLKVKRENVNCVFREGHYAECTVAGVTTSLSGKVSDWYTESWSCNSEWSWAEWNYEYGNGRRMTGSESKTKIVPGLGKDDACNIASKVGYAGMK